MSLYKYVSCDTAMKILSGTIRMTQPSEFNDPFELTVELYVPPDVEDINYNLSFDTLSLREELGDYILQGDFESEFCNHLNSLKIKRELDSKIGILCLSKKRDSHLMWAHYTGNHSGAVFEFYNNHPFFDGQIDVEYRSERLRIDFNYFIKRELPIPLSMLFSKPDAWKYEEEVRITRDLVNLTTSGDASDSLPIYLAELPLECVKSITLGIKSSKESVLAIYNEIKDTQIELNLADISPQGYEFIYDPIKSNAPFSEKPEIISIRIAEIFKNENGYIGDMARMVQAANNSHLRWISKSKKTQ